MYNGVLEMMPDGSSMLDLENVLADGMDEFCQDCGCRLPSENYINGDDYCDKCWSKYYLELSAMYFIATYKNKVLEVTK
jgi:hypothetical protein